MNFVQFVAKTYLDMQCYVVNHGPVVGNHRDTDGRQQTVHGKQHRGQVLLCQTYDTLKKSKQWTGFNSLLLGEHIAHIIWLNTVQQIFCLSTK